MSDENKFFRWVWRFNGIVIALVVLVAAAGVGYQAWRSFNQEDWSRPAGHFAPVPKAAEQNATYRLESDDYGVSRTQLALGAVHEQVIPLKRWEAPPKDYGLRSSYSLMEMRISTGSMAVGAVNLLIVDGDTGSSRWMFKGYGRMILTADAVYPANAVASASGTYETDAIGLVLTVRERDTNHDGKVDEKDGVTLYAYLAGMPEPMKLVSAEIIIAMRQTGSEKYQIIFEDAKTAYTATFSITDFKLISKKPLPNVPK